MTAPPFAYFGGKTILADRRGGTLRNTGWRHFVDPHGTNRSMGRAPLLLPATHPPLVSAAAVAAGKAFGVNPRLPLPGAESDGDDLTGSIADGKASDGREALRGDLTRLIDEVGLTPFEIEEWKVDELAGRLLTAGWRRVVEGDDTIERLAQAMWFGPPEWTARIVQQEYAPTWRAKARAVVRALREET